MRIHLRSLWLVPLAAAALFGLVRPTRAAPPDPASWERDNPIRPLPRPPLGVQADFSKVPWVTPEKARLGRWLFYDARLSKDESISCASCHRPENAFSEPTPHSKGVGGQEGKRKAPTVINTAFPFYPVYFWDGRAGSLAEQAKGPIANPIEMASTHDACCGRVAGIPGYKKYFQEAFGDGRVTIDRIAEAIASYEATRLSGNSPWDRWKAGDESAVSAEVKKGDELFFGKARCAQCHVGWNFTDSKFHNLGVGIIEGAPNGAGVEAIFADVGRYAVTKNEEDLGAFKTPTLREVNKHAPYMHDGSIATLREVVEHYDKGGTPNPHLDPKMKKLGLTPDEIDALVAFMKALDGEGWQDTPPASFPQ
jgi:cytochrome c peroxidase